MSEALERVYEHFQSLQSASLGDSEWFGKLVPGLESFLGPDPTGVQLITTKSERRIRRRQEDTGRSKKQRQRSPQRGTSDQPRGLEQDFVWTARSSDGSQTVQLTDEDRISLDWVDVTGSIRNTTLGFEARYWEDLTGVQLILVILGTSIDGFYEQLTRDAYNPDLERLVLSEPRVVFSTAKRSYFVEGIRFPIYDGISIIAKAQPSPNVQATMEGGQPLFLWGHLTPAEGVRLNLRTYPEFAVKLGPRTVLHESYFDIRVLDAWLKYFDDSDREDERDPEDPSSEEKAGELARLAVGGWVKAGDHQWWLYTDVPADHQTLAFGLGGYGTDPAFETLEPLKPLIAGRSHWIEYLDAPFSGTGIVPSSWGFKLRGLLYYYDLPRQLLTSAAIVLEVQREVDLKVHRWQIHLSAISLNWSIPFPEHDQATLVNLWAKGKMKIGECELEMGMSWQQPGFRMTGTYSGDWPALFDALQLTPLVQLPQVEECIVAFNGGGNNTLTLVSGSQSVVLTIV